MHYLLHRKVEYKPSNTSITNEVSKYCIQSGKNTINPRLTNSNDGKNGRG